ncbi:hypothetical protein GcM3_146020 [Golovinomyces cichoracearum]|uniref:Uncharacterized protein n=1 Tax=Golovinomyces cichoracearum TaxID=62708 RepID=A0A420HYZ2_9PEZI|nr:hypothetical protein GcM3_146020 [Golovinomyces cichoracearum]
MIDSKVDAAASVRDGSDTGAGANVGAGSDVGTGAGVGTSIGVGAEANVEVGAGAGRISNTISSYTLVFSLSLSLLGRPLFFRRGNWLGVP